MSRVMVVEPDPTTPDPVAHWRAWTRWLQEQAKRFKHTPSNKKWMHTSVTSIPDSI